MGSIDAVTQEINRRAWALWLVLIGSLGLAAAVGIDRIAPPSEAGGVGAGMVVGDWAAAVLCAWASAALVVVRGAASAGGSPLVAAGDWLQLLALTVAGVRVSWMLALYGDATLSPTALIALVMFAASSLSYSISRMIRIGEQRRGDDEAPTC